MRSVLFWLLVVYTSLVPTYIEASDNPHMESCIQIVSVIKDTDDSTDTNVNCSFISNAHQVSCLKVMSLGFSRWGISPDFLYDGIHFNHIAACILFGRNTQVECLNEIAKQRLPSIRDILDCSDKYESD